VIEKETRSRIFLAVIISLEYAMQLIDGASEEKKYAIVT
jgi:hypothetical protein